MRPEVAISVRFSVDANGGILKSLGDPPLSKIDAFEEGDLVLSE
jgi:hypothetical protein